MPKVSLSWPEARDLYLRLADEVLKPRLDLTAIVAVSRGGFIPARIMSDPLGIKLLASIGIDYQDPSRTNPRVYSLPQFSSPSQKILLVEDLVESGRSLGKAHSGLVDAGHEVTTAAAYQRSWSVVSPDITLGVNDADIRFPWEP